MSKKISQQKYTHEWTLMVAATVLTVAFVAQIALDAYSDISLLRRLSTEVGNAIGFISFSVIPIVIFIMCITLLRRYSVYERLIYSALYVSALMSLNFIVNTTGVNSFFTHLGGFEKWKQFLAWYLLSVTVMGVIIYQSTSRTKKWFEWSFKRPFIITVALGMVVVMLFQLSYTAQTFSHNIGARSNLTEYVPFMPAPLFLVLWIIFLRTKLRSYAAVYALMFTIGIFSLYQTARYVGAVNGVPFYL